MRRLLWILLAALTIALLILVLRQNEAALDELAHFESASIEAKITAAVLIGLIALTLFRQRFSHILESVLIWTAVLLLLLLGYTYRFELRDVADRVLAELMPGRAATRGRTVEIARGGGGSFSVTTQVNGARVAMVLDTGASSVVLTQEAAKAAGLSKSSTIRFKSTPPMAAPAPRRSRSTASRSATSPNDPSPR